mmetsp:Transcript_168668/g.541988  ORF Transcript_168668/g.541988 Transcript_168668/m.541988 type:complete len:301 (+) Transcript_168668:1084-1986(+)
MVATAVGSRPNSPMARLCRRCATRAGVRFSNMEWLRWTASAARDHKELVSACAPIQFTPSPSVRPVSSRSSFCSRPPPREASALGLRGSASDASACSASASSSISSSSSTSSSSSSPAPSSSPTFLVSSKAARICSSTSAAASALGASARPRVSQLTKRSTLRPEPMRSCLNSPTAHKAAIAASGVRSLAPAPRTSCTMSEFSMGLRTGASSRSVAAAQSASLAFCADKSLALLSMHSKSTGMVFLTAVSSTSWPSLRISVSTAMLKRVFDKSSASNAPRSAPATTRGMSSTAARAARMP